MAIENQTIEVTNYNKFLAVINSDLKMKELRSQMRYAEMNERINELREQFNVKSFVDGSLVPH